MGQHICQNMSTYVKLVDWDVLALLESDSIRTYNVCLDMSENGLYPQLKPLGVGIMR